MCVHRGEGRRVVVVVVVGNRRRREGERRSKLKGNARRSKRARRGGADSFGSARVSWIWRIRLVCSPRRGAPRRPPLASSGMKPSETTTTTTTNTNTTTTTGRRERMESKRDDGEDPRPTERRGREGRRGHEPKRTEGITDEPVVRNTCLREPRPPCLLPCLSARPSVRGQPRRRRCITIGDSPSSSFSPFISVRNVRRLPPPPPLFHDTLVAAPPRFAHSLEGNEQIKAAPAGASIRRPCSRFRNAAPKETCTYIPVRIPRVSQTRQIHDGFRSVFENYSNLG